MRKVFITGIPMQNIDKYEYSYLGDDDMNMSFSTAFPIMYAMKNRIQDGDDYCVLAIQMKNDKTDEMLERFMEEMKENGLDDSKVIPIVVEENQNSEMTEMLMIKLLEQIKNYDDIYCNIEYGTKPMTVSIMYAVQIAVNTIRDVDIQGFYYGEAKRKNGKITETVLYNITSLFYLNQLLGDMGYSVDASENPVQIVKNLMEINKNLN